MVERSGRPLAASNGRVVHQLFSLDGVWTVDPQLTTATDAAGGKTYSFAGRSLSALRCPSLGHVLLYMDSGRSIERSLESASVPRAEWSHYVRMLKHLHEMGALTESISSAPSGAGTTTS